MVIEYKTISGWRDLEEYGIEVLTGESCAYSMRLLCDLDQNGEQLIKEFFGIPQNTYHRCPECGEADTYRTQLGQNWNHTGCTPLPHIASVMLSRNIFTDLAVYLLLREGYGVVILRQNKATGYTREVWEDEFRDIFEKAGYTGYRVYTQPTGPARNGRHVHMMSGRTE